MLWVEKITVVPPPARPETNSQSRARWRGSRPTLGSSSSRTTGRASSPIAMLIRCWLPPERRIDLVVAALGERRQLEHLLDARLRVLVPLEAGEEAQVLLHRQAPVERRLLGHPADLAARQVDLAVVGTDDAGEDREQRRLAGAVGADHGQQLARPGAEVDPAQRLAVAVALDEPAGLERGGAVGRGGLRRLAARRES